MVLFTWIYRNIWTSRLIAMEKRFLVLDCWISRTNMDTAVDDVARQANAGKGGYVCFSNVHSVVTSRHDLQLRKVTNESLMSMPDGKPIAVIGRLCGAKDLSQVSGPDFMPEFMEKMLDSRHYLYGATENTLKLLSEKLVVNIPRLNIVGRYAPPFGELTEEEECEILETIKKSLPDYIWVGLGAPKQEYWMAKHWAELKPAVLFGVGAAFDFHAGTKSRAPRWMRRVGLEWLHRLVSEPRRLWRRYLYTNLIFIFAAIKMLLNNCRTSHVDRQ